MLSDQYQSIENPSEGLFKDRGSKFFAYLYPIQSIEQVKGYLNLSRKTHPKARHHCFAYAIGINREPSTSSDDGEPSGSAGRPILGQILSSDISDCLIIVVRYFGGTKLGVPGLINAYKEAARDAIDNGVIIKKQLTNRYQLNAPFSLMGKVLEAFKRTHIDMSNKKFEMDVEIVFELKLSESERKLHELKAFLLGINPNELEEELNLGEIEINQL